MSSARWIRQGLLASLTLVVIACAEPPDREMQQAQGAIDAARAAGADVYAVEEFDAAQLALANAQAAVTARDYRLALSHAVDSRDRAQQAARMAADGKAVARVEADRALTRFADAIEAARAAVTAAQGSRIHAAVMTRATDALSHADRQLQEARTAFDGGAYARVVTITTDALPPLQVAAADLAAAQLPAARRAR